MKSHHEEIIKAEYPVLKKHDASKLVILFCSPSCGMVVVPDSSGSSNPLGTYKSEWNEFNFKPIPGKITLQND